jgi:hypothetical protein
LDEGRRAIALTPVEKDVNNGSRVLNISPLQQRGRARRSLLCSNWKLDCVLPPQRSC